MGWVWCSTPVIPDTWKGEVRGSRPEEGEEEEEGRGGERKGEEEKGRERRRVELREWEGRGGERRGGEREEFLSQLVLKNPFSIKKLKQIQML
jgi:hypothetical protein